MPSSHDLPVLAEIVCVTCGQRSYNPAGEPIPRCESCGGDMQVGDTFRDRRRVSAPVKEDRRK